MNDIVKDFLTAENFYLIDALDLQRLLAMHHDKMDLGLVREYSKLFDKEALLVEWLAKAK